MARSATKRRPAVPKAAEGEINPKAPCPCGSGRRYKHCHGSGYAPPVTRPFEGLPGEPDWVALREVVPAATAPLKLKEDGHDVMLATVLPMAWPALVRADGRIVLGLQVASRSGDVSRDLGWALEQALTAEPGSPVEPSGLPGPGPRLQDLIADSPLDVTVHEGFEFWIEGDVEDQDGEIADSLERANANVVPTVKLASAPAAYWCQMRGRAHLRWALPHDEEPVAALQVRLNEALASPRTLTSDERRARAGLLSRQLTLR